MDVLMLLPMPVLEHYLFIALVAWYASPNPETTLVVNRLEYQWYEHQGCWVKWASLHDSARHAAFDRVGCVWVRHT